MLAISVCGYAVNPMQTQIENTKKSIKSVNLGEGPVDSLAQQRLIDRYYADEFRRLQDPKLPYFQFMSRDGKIAMGIGVKVEAIAHYDWDGSMDGSDFAPYNIPIPLNRADVNRFQTTMGESSIFLSIIGESDIFGEFQVYVQGKFADGRAFTLKQAYATVGDWTGGLANSTFSDPASQPATIETAGPNSEIGYKRVLLRYMHGFTPNFKVALSAEAPKFSIPENPDCQTSSGYMPDFAAFVQYGNGGQHLRLSGVVKGMRYHDLTASRNRYVTGWGVMLSTVFNPVSPVTVYAAAQTGRGIGNLVNDLSCGANDLLSMADDPSRMYAPKSYGWYAAMQYNFKPNIYSTIIFSQERILPKRGSDYGADAYKYGLYGTANLIWEITPRLQVGGEINIGKKMEMGGANRMGYRADVMASISF